MSSFRPYDRHHTDSISIEKNIALIAVVGRGMKNAKGTAAAVFMALAEKDINIRMIDQGSSELNIIVGVDNAILKNQYDNLRQICHLKLLLNSRFTVGKASKRVLYCYHFKGS